MVFSLATTPRLEATLWAEQSPYTSQVLSNKRGCSPSLNESAAPTVDCNPSLGHSRGLGARAPRCPSWQELHGTGDNYLTLVPTFSSTKPTLSCQNTHDNSVRGRKPHLSFHICEALTALLSPSALQNRNDTWKSLLCPLRSAWKSQLDAISTRMKVSQFTDCIPCSIAFQHGGKGLGSFGYIPQFDLFSAPGLLQRTV